MRGLESVCLIVVTLVASLPGAVAADEPLAVIVSESWSLEEISIPALRTLYLGRRTRLEGARVVCYDLRSGSETRQAFSLAVLGKTELEMADYWIEQALTGGDLPPRELPEASDVIRAVARSSGAIGYVPWSRLTPERPLGIRVLYILVGGRKWLPADAQYPIRMLAEASPPERGKVQGER